MINSLQLKTFKMITTNLKDPNEASISLEAISEMAETMNETYEQMKRIPKHLYGQYYLREKAKYDASRVMMKYNGWKMQGTGVGRGFLR